MMSAGMVVVRTAVAPPFVDAKAVQAVPKRRPPLGKTTAILRWRPRTVFEFTGIRRNGVVVPGVGFALSQKSMYAVALWEAWGIISIFVTRAAIENTVCSVVFVHADPETAQLHFAAMPFLACGAPLRGGKSDPAEATAR